jgi:NAD(P)-dependent dehydrogenase (short-subunit alcohol dehydrogenase family)
MMRRALVTGGTRGIGAGIVLALAEAGFSVTACGLTEEECASFPATPRVTTRVLDVTRDASVAETIASLPSLDLLVNCAGVIQRAGREFEIDGFRQTLEVNLVGTMRMCIAGRPLLAQGGGSIVNTASMLTFQGSPFVPGYAASKGGVGQLTKSLSAAWAGEGIRVNAIAPGWIDTDMTAPLGPMKAGIAMQTPLRRLGEPDDIAWAAVYLASEEARYMTGQVISPNGGWYMSQ